MGRASARLFLIHHPTGTLVAEYFLADIHLSTERPDITAAFRATLAALARDASAVYILGDLQPQDRLSRHVARLLDAAPGPGGDDRRERARR